MARQQVQSPEELYALALSQVETSQAELALQTAQRLLTLVSSPQAPQLALPALNLLGEISVELGDAASAQQYFLKAVEIDPEGSVKEEVGGGAEKFLWMAQLCEEGGADSVSWFERGVRALKAEIQGLEAQDTRPLSEEQKEFRDVALEEKRGKLANALCGVVEVYMTDLS